MQCQICREETSDFNESTYLSRHYLKKATGPIPETGAEPFLRAVHLACVHMPNMLSADNFKNG